jgi:hypothetical protein
MSGINSRRKFLTSGIGFLGTCFAAGPGMARVGSDSDRGSNQLTDFLDATQYSQTDIVDLSRKELTYLHNYRIDGFLDAMASNVVKMMLSDRASTRQLLQDMANINAKSARTERLAEEVSRVSAMESNLTQSITRLKSAQGAETAQALADEKRRLRRASVYKRAVKSWLRYPREGTYKPPFALSIDIKL